MAVLNRLNPEEEPEEHTDLWEYGYGTMSATMKAGFLLVILAGFFFPSAAQGNSTIAAASDPSTTILTTNANSEGSTATQPTTANATVKFCESKPCGTAAAICTEIYDGRICRCTYGYYYDEQAKSCSLGKQFFGSVTVEVPYSSQFENVMSPEYKWLYNNVTAFFTLCFPNDTNYAETIITKITQTAVKSRSLKAAAGTTDIEAISIFAASSTITQDNVTTLINNAINDTQGLLITGYKKSEPCNSPFCDEATTTCKSTETTVVCDCKAGYYSRLPFSKSCLDCEVSCTAKNKKECIQKESEIGSFPVCQCLINHKPGANVEAPCVECDYGDTEVQCKQYCNASCTAKNKKECIQKESENGSVPDCQCLINHKLGANVEDPCVECDYGYSGVDCENSFQLVLIIVGSIAGALVLALLGGVIALSLKSKKAGKSPDRERLIKPEDNAVFGSSQSTEVPQFPRVAVKPSTNTNKASTANPYETDEPFQRTVPTRDYDDDTDSWFEMAPKNTAFGNNSKY